MRKSLGQGGHEGLHTAEPGHTGLSRTGSETFYKLGTFLAQFLHNVSKLCMGVSAARKQGYPLNNKSASSGLSLSKTPPPKIFNE